MKISVDSIQIPERFRSENNDVSDIIDSFAEHGQLQPILVSANQDNTFTLVSGWRRLSAAKALGWTHIEATTRETLDDVTRKELEYEENVCRADFTWQERCVAIAELHELRKKKDPEWGMRQTAALLGIRGHSNVAYALYVAERIRNNDEEIANQPSLKAAVDLLVKRKLVEASKRVAETRLPTGEIPVNLPKPPPTTKTDEETVTQTRKIYRPLKVRLMNVDCIELLNILANEGVKIHCIFTDPPYGVDLGNFAQTNTKISSKLDLVEETHNQTENLILLERFITEAYNLVANPCWMFLWADFWVWQRLADIGMRVGWRVQRWPLLWIKPDHNFNQMPHSNFTKAAECGILMAKGTAVLCKTAPQNFVSYPNRKPDSVTNPFWKPPEVHAHFLSALAPEGTLVVDPFCGSGSIAEAAGVIGLDYIGGDIDITHIANLKTRLGI